MDLFFAEFVCETCPFHQNLRIHNHYGTLFAAFCGLQFGVCT